MKAITYQRYGDPSVLRLDDVDVPVPKDNEVLVRVKAASINSWDWDMIRGSPVFVRMWGLWAPRHKIPGADIAGTVEAVGKDVKRFKPGDDVFGDLCESGWGGFAEYATANESALAAKPTFMSFEDAAAMPQAGRMAMQSVYDNASVRPGQHVLLNGAAGGVGTFALQMCKDIGAEVTAVDSTAKLEFLTRLGADHVIDYSKEDFTGNAIQYDYIIDVVADKPLRRYKSSLAAGGAFIMIGGSTRTIVTCMIFGKMISGGGRRIGMLAYRPNAGLERIAVLYQQNKIRPVIDKRFALADTPKAFEYFAQGNVLGKIVITISE